MFGNIAPWSLEAHKDETRNVSVALTHSLREWVYHVGGICRWREDEVLRYMVWVYFYILSKTEHTLTCCGDLCEHFKDFRDLQPATQHEYSNEAGDMISADFPWVLQQLLEARAHANGRSTGSLVRQAISRHRQLVRTRRDGANLGLLCGNTKTGTLIDLNGLLDNPSNWNFKDAVRYVA